MSARSLGNTLFWRIVAILVIAELTVAAVAIGLTVRFATERSRELAVTSIESRLDAVAEEIERRSSIQDGRLHVAGALLADLALRFPDPVAILDLDGEVRHVIHADPTAFPEVRVDTTGTPEVPDAQALFSGLVVDATDNGLPGGYAVAPLYDAVGFPVGALLVQPLRQSMAWELSGANQAARESLRLVAVLAVILALLTGGGVTWWLVAPLRRIATRVSEIGKGDYGVRVDVQGTHEIALVATAVNRMADDIQRNITAMQSAHQLRQELVANVGHDLRTPLAAVQAWLEEAVRFEAEGRHADASMAVEGAERQVRRIRSLVDDLFELAVLEQSGSRLVSEPVPLGELVSDAVETVAVRTPDGVRVVIRPPEVWPMVQGDGSRLLRMLTNVLSNAVAFARTSVQIAVGTDEHALVITIRDDGPGLAPDEVERVFDRYYRGTDARTRKSGTDAGTGLGLAIARAVAEAHGGRIWMESVPGEGTAVHIRLPNPIGASWKAS
ncbi:MAG: HAMP domain-containing sensor histidine kinase [Rhodothermales bacterium]